MILAQGWDSQLRDVINDERFAGIQAFLNERRQQTVVFPPEGEVFNAYRFTDFENVRVVILGQDPYHEKGQAHGLAFSVPEGVKIPPSLRNIFKVLSRLSETETAVGFDTANAPLSSENTTGIEKANAQLASEKRTELERANTPQLCNNKYINGNLDYLAKQGVFLLNTVLTVEEGRANSHKNIGWEWFTDKTIEVLNKSETPIVFLLWGAQAQEKECLIANPKHLVLKTAHPSPLSARRGFFECGHFSKTNEFLMRNGLAPIEWQR